MAVCKCFINDQLLPVRAGCEAIYCKDVNSDTAIRNEALSRITSLRAEVARLEGEAAPLRAALEQLKNVAKGIAHCYDELDEDERRELQQVCAESEAILLSPDAGKGWLPPEEQVQQDFDRWQDEHMAAGPGKIPACLGPGCPGCKLAKEKLAAALDALKGVE